MAHSNETVMSALQAVTALLAERPHGGNCPARYSNICTCGQRAALELANAAIRGAARAVTCPATAAPHSEPQRRANVDILPHGSAAASVDEIVEAQWENSGAPKGGR